MSLQCVWSVELATRSNETAVAAATHSAVPDAAAEPAAAVPWSMKSDDDMLFAWLVLPGRRLLRVVVHAPVLKQGVCQQQVVR